MSNLCCICGLGDEDNFSPKTPVIVEALQKIVKSLLKKESSDQLLAQERENDKKEINDLTAENNKLQQEIKHLYNSLSSARERSDQYKHKFLCAQESLEKLHKKNQELAKKCNKVTVKQDKETEKPFPFKVSQATEDTERQKVILAPDTCYTQAHNHEWMNEELLDNDRPTTSNSVNDNDGFAKPAAPGKVGLHTKAAQRLKSMTHCTVDLVDCSVDPDETCLQGHSVLGDGEHSDEDEDFSIPPSPVLSGSVLTSKRFPNVFDKTSDQTKVSKKSGTTLSKKEDKEQSSKHSFFEDDDCDLGSPSLLRMPDKYPKSDQVSKNFEGSKSENLVPKVIDLQDSCEDYPNSTIKDSLVIHHKQTKKATISPIKFPTETKSVGHTSIDELFEKTYGELQTSFENDLTTTRELDLDETHLNAGIEESVANNAHDASIVISDDDQESDTSDLDDFAVTTSKQPPTKIKRTMQTHSKYDPDDSFDVVPKKNKETGFKYQSVVRKRGDREKLEAKSCPQCEAYYSDLPPDERERALKDICRHRHEYAPPSSPEHFWEIGIPSTAECRRRGYIQDEGDLTPRGRAEAGNRRRRKKPLQARFNTKT